VNSHPRHRNACLRELAGLHGKHQEFVPEWVVRRVDREIEAADWVLVPSEYVASQIAAHGVPRKRIAVIPYGVDLSAFRPAEATRPGPVVECLYVGQISHGKGIPFLMEAARRCRRLPVRFTLHGPLVSPEVLENCPDNVRYRGRIHPAAVPRAMREAQIFLFPTLDDSFGLVILEAIASGLAVISTPNAGGIEGFANGRDVLIVPPGDSVALAAAIETLADDRAARARFAQSALTRVRAERSWSPYGEQVLGLLFGSADPGRQAE
jgi:glycosyltransferase involved in cell wall biosynthesis